MRGSKSPQKLPLVKKGLNSGSPSKSTKALTAAEKSPAKSVSKIEGEDESDNKPIDFTGFLFHTGLQAVIHAATAFEHLFVKTAT